MPSVKRDKEQKDKTFTIFFASNGKMLVSRVSGNLLFWEIRERLGQSAPDISESLKEYARKASVGAVISFSLRYNFAVCRNE